MRSVTLSCWGDQYENLIVRCLEIADSELGQAPCELGGVIGSADANALGGVGACLPEPWPPEGEVLEREPKRFRVGELAVEVEQRRLQRGELVVLEIEPVEEVVLGAERVELLTRELVALGVEWDPERGQLRPVRIETTGERLSDISE